MSADLVEFIREDRNLSFNGERVKKMSMSEASKREVECLLMRGSRQGADVRMVFHVRG